MPNLDVSTFFAGALSPQSSRVHADLHAWLGQLLAGVFGGLDPSMRGALIVPQVGTEAGTLINVPSTAPNRYQRSLDALWSSGSRAVVQPGRDELALVYQPISDGGTMQLGYIWCACIPARVTEVASSLRTAADAVALRVSFEK